MPTCFKAGWFLTLLVTTLNEMGCNAILLYGLSGNAPEYLTLSHDCTLPFVLWSNHLMWLRFIDLDQTQVCLLRCQLRKEDTEPSVVWSNLSCFLHWWYQCYAKCEHEEEKRAAEDLALLPISYCWTHPDTAVNRNRMSTNIWWNLQFSQVSSSWEISFKKTCKATLQEKETE